MDEDKLYSNYSNGQYWELEIICKNKRFLDRVVKDILSHGVIDFEVNLIDKLPEDNGFDGRYIVFMSCHWFHNLKLLVDDLAKIEQDFEKENI